MLDPLLYELFLKTLFLPRIKEGPLSVLSFLLYVLYLAGYRDSNPSCCDRSHGVLPMSYSLGLPVTTETVAITVINQMVITCRNIHIKHC